MEATNPLARLLLAVWYGQRDGICQSIYPAFGADHPDGSLFVVATIGGVVGFLFWVLISRAHKIIKWGPTVYNAVFAPCPKLWAATLPVLSVLIFIGGWRILATDYAKTESASQTPAPPPVQQRTAIAPNGVAVGGDNYGNLTVNNQIEPTPEQSRKITAEKIIKWGAALGPDFKRDLDAAIASKAYFIEGSVTEDNYTLLLKIINEDSSGLIKIVDLKPGVIGFIQGERWRVFRLTFAASTFPQKSN